MGKRKTGSMQLSKLNDQGAHRCQDIMAFLLGNISKVGPVETKESFLIEENKD